MAARLSGTRIGILIEHEFEAADVLRPLEMLRASGATVVVIGPTAGTSFRDRTGAVVVVADQAAGAVRASEIEAIVVPGGHAPDRMRMRHAMVDLVADAMAGGRLVAAIGRGPQVLISANVVRGRTLTCWPSIAVDVQNAGGSYVDRPVVRDGNLVTSRKSDELPVFCEAIVQALAGR